jgi:hypothetical protein
MTEAEWLAATDPGPMLDFIRGRASDRKLRLFAVACSRRIWHLLEDERCRFSVDVAERYAENFATEDEREGAAVAIDPGTDDDPRANVAWFAAAAASACSYPAASLLTHPAIAAHFAAQAAAWAVAARGPAREAAWQAELQAERQAQSRLLAEIIHPHPSRLAPAIDPRGPLVAHRLAREIDEQGAFDRLPILADALEDAGCGSPELLAHLRSPGPHVRGCWALDLVLGKE